jgi:outer membrane protein assembly factor BamB
VALQDRGGDAGWRSAGYRRWAGFAATGDGNLIALNSKTGAPLWRFQTGAGIGASPMSYSVDGQQFVAISAGNVLYSFALPQ